jgi:hypothetical protein
MKTKLFLLFIAILLITPVFATQVIPVDFDQMTIKADKIFSGKVINIEVKKDYIPSRNAYMPCTFYTFTILDKIKGSFASNTITVRFMGGTMPNEKLGVRVNGMPEFKMGEEVVLFLEGDNTLYSPVIGFYQGRFTTKVDKSTGSKMMFNFMGKPVTAGFIDKKIKDPTARSAPVNYEYFKAQIQSYIK